MVKVFKISRSGYYAWVVRKPSGREHKDQELTEQIKKIFEVHFKRYGSPRIWVELKEKGARISRKRVERLMREQKIYARTRRKRVKTTDSAHEHETAENILNRAFSAELPGEKWVSDITYLRTTEGWRYLAIILDLYDRKILGWTIADEMTAGMVCRALDMAGRNRTPREGMLFHSDRGAQYCSEEFRSALKKLCPSAIQSMSRKGNCWDNACAESFFKTLKSELEVLEGRHRARAVQTAMFEYIEMYYNRRRRHSALGYATPIAFTATNAA